MKRVIKSSSQVKLTSQDKQRLEDMCESMLYETWDNYKYDEYSMDDIAEIVWEHIETWISEDPEEFSPTLAASVKDTYGETYGYTISYVYKHYDDYSWE